MNVHVSAYEHQLALELQPSLSLTGLVYLQSTWTPIPDFSTLLSALLTPGGTTSLRPIMGNFLEGNPAVLMWSPSGSVTTNAVPLHLVIVTYTPGFENRAFRLRFYRLLLLLCPGSKDRKAVFSASFY